MGLTESSETQEKLIDSTLSTPKMEKEERNVLKSEKDGDNQMDMTPSKIIEENLSKNVEAMHNMLPNPKHVQTERNPFDSPGISPYVQPRRRLRRAMETRRILK